MIHGRHNVPCTADVGLHPRTRLDTALETYRLDGIVAGMDTPPTLKSGSTRRVRDPVRTRRSIVEAGVQLILAHGRPASLEQVAAAAGVSKGGVLYHFGSQEDLAVAICHHSVQQLWEGVQELIEDDDVAPGRVLRAYVRALLGHSPTASAALTHSWILVFFREIEAVQELCRSDAQRWREAFQADGVSQQDWLVVRIAAESLAPSFATPYVTDAEKETVRARLLEIAGATRVKP